ncbi:hypothetical protein CAPTEDRAFT_138523 [Capitella teleta]|uniref:Sulfatase N-terminal domain-containing protein n=1 Tax=Capitella teleta TaxID=283909 RepID=R7V9D9_CAPTE|nr:hypothetical protein CAPTEDRAFT_138523 [Capitella teleta]|eukprot:ELU15164.1 hypothetical protein CAPTEDRAFT_138523 [Capitella teleta]
MAGIYHYQNSGYFEEVPKAIPVTVEASIPRGVEDEAFDTEHTDYESQVPKDHKVTIETTTVEASTPQPSKLNVLYISADDFRPEIGAFLDPETRPWLNSAIKTPNLDALAERSLVLRRAYVQVARCNPSRVSIMTSRRPNTTHIINNDKWFRNVAHGQTIMTIPEYFKMNGYSSVGTGKIFHMLPGVAGTQDQGRSWTTEFYQPLENYEDTVDNSWKAVPKEELVDFPLRDQMTVAHALRALQYEANRPEKDKRPFFMAVGMKKPHVPYVFPDEFLEWYPREDIKVAEHDYVPVNMSKWHWHNSRNTLNFPDIFKYKEAWDINSTLPDNVAIDLRRAYYASVSYVDSLIGIILNELDKLQLRERTIVAFLSDHGYQLGEHGIWGKDTNLEQATNAPMMISIPGRTDKRIDSFRLIEFVDLFPTLVDAAGLPPLPKCPLYSEEIPACTEGSSMMPLLNDPSSTDPNIKWKDRVFSQYPYPDMGKPEFMGYSVRTKHFLYVEWIRCKGVVNGVWPEPVFKELYDIDRDIHQDRNVISDSVYANKVNELSRLLRDGWVAALPQ